MNEEWYECGVEWLSDQMIVGWDLLQYLPQQIIFPTDPPPNCNEQSHSFLHEKFNE